ncbi:hypothetical protein BCU12_17885 [Vibrio sp. 10N.261.55.A7]|nr:hypothetical protein BCU12_17885 [Vibrio sp. 10N.261.55.A7]
MIKTEQSTGDLKVFPNNDLANLIFIETINIFYKFVGNIVEIKVFSPSSWVIIKDCPAILS